MFLEKIGESESLKGNQTGKEGIVFNIQRYSIHDGPGIRTTVFLKGCPLSCKWCSNPESINPYPEIFFRREKCDQCGKCLDVCTLNAITLTEGSIQINRAKCNLCMKCEEICSVGAINHIGNKMTVNEILTEVMRDELFYYNSGGGVTISGGEPLFQFEFTLNLLKAFKKESLHTTIDTTGYVKSEDFDNVLPYTDLLLFDIKHLNPEIHQKGTKVANDLIIKNFETCLKKGKKVWIRIPIIPDFNDSLQYIETLAGYLSNKPIEKVSLLKYHEWGKHKYKYLDRVYPLKDTYFISDEQMQDIKNTMESHGLNITIDY
ncbi:MAG: glycyl-radical enzyme activating protein [Promethearchaeota archaeon]